MTAIQIVQLALQISIALIVISSALRAGLEGATWLLRRPSLLVRSLLAMIVVMPFLGALLARLFHIRPSVEAALILLAVSPVPPILTGKEAKAGGNVAYGVGLLAVSAVVSIFTIPLSVTLIGRWFGLELSVPPAAIAIVVAKSVLAPLAIGVLVKAMAPGLAARLARPLSLLGMVVLLVGLVPIVMKMWPALAAQATVPSLIGIVLFTLLSMAVGHLLGGPDADNRSVLALSTACRHPGVAMAITTAAAMPDEKPLLAAAVFLCVIVAAVVTGPYAKWRGKTAAGRGPQQPELT